MKNENTKHAAMTPKTQSVCKHCQKEIVRASFGWATAFSGDVLCFTEMSRNPRQGGHEPAAEPAFYRSASLQESIAQDEVERAARPSEPSARTCDWPFSGTGICGQSEACMKANRCLKNLPAAPQTSAEPSTYYAQCQCHNCETYRKSLNTPAPQPAPGVKVTIYDPIAYLQEMYADMGKRGECEICLKLQFCIEVLKEKLAGDAPNSVCGIDTPHTVDCGCVPNLEEIVKRHFPSRWFGSGTVEELHPQLAQAMKAVQDAVKHLRAGDAPKVEEIIDALEDLLTDCVEDSDNGTMYWTNEGRQRAAAILRPYFPPASQTPSFEAWWDRVNPVNHQIPEYPRDEKKYWAKLAWDAATPASTARTDGWVSLNDRLPEPSDDVYYEMLHGTDDRSFAYYDPAGAKKEGNNPDWCWFDREENAWCHKDRYTHWKLITAAPGSVPQAPKDECLYGPVGKHIFNPHDDEPRRCVNCGVPQAEPPKEEKP